MREAGIIDVTDCLTRPASYDAIIDVRSPAEYALDHLPGAINLPVLDNAQRAIVGTLHAQDSAFVARRVGAALVSRNIATILSDQLGDKPANWRPVIYCWRGGNRSMSLATVLARIGWPTAVIDGGYRSYRRWVVSAIETSAPTLQWRVIAGRTGSGKSRILQALADQGAQVLDLEGLANHRGSVLGLLPDQTQPTQKHFESRLIEAMMRLDRSRPVFVESESRRIGVVQLPESVILQIRQAPCLVIDLPIDDRAAFLMLDYPHFLQNPQALRLRLDRLHEMHGAKRLAAWQALIDAGDWHSLVRALLEEHYDPAYDRSMRRNFAQLATARHITLSPGNTPIEQYFSAAAQRIIELTG